MFEEYIQQTFSLITFHHETFTVKILQQLCFQQHRYANCFSVEAMVIDLDPDQ